MRVVCPYRAWACRYMPLAWWVDAQAAFERVINDSRLAIRLALKE